MNTLRILLMAALFVVVFGSMEVVAERPTLSYVGSYDTDSYALGVTISGDYAYIADYENGLIILNIEEPSNPTFAGSYDTEGLAYRVTISGNYAYVADWNNGVIILNIEDPSNPIFVGSYDAKPAWSVTISGNYGYVSVYSNGLVILNIEDPSNPTFVGSYDTDSYFREAIISGNYAYIADQNEGLIILNIEDPSTPTFVGSYDTEFYGRDVTISGNYAYVADDDKGLVILNIEDPFNLTFVGNYNTAGPATDVIISGNYAYVADAHKGMVTINIENRSNPTFVRNYDIDGASDVIISGNFVYVANHVGLVILYENPAEYSVIVVDDVVNLDVRPGASGVGCTEMVISNLGTITIDVDVSSSGDNITISPGAFSVTLAPEKNITVSVCALALTQSEAKIVPVSVIANGREVNTQLNLEVTSNFTASIDPYARLSIQAQQPYAEHCIGSTFWTNFTGVNNGNAQDNIVFQLVNSTDLESSSVFDAGFVITLPILQYQIERSGEQKLSIKVVSENVTEGHYTMLVRIATTMEGESEARTVTATINMINCQPVAIAGKDITVKEGEVVQFSGAGTRAKGSIVLYEWDFDGDGVFEWSSEDNGISTFFYNDGGVYLTTLRVTDNEGNTAVDNRTITVIADIKPVAIAGKDITVKEGEIIQFSGAGTRVKGSIVLYEWDFDGDGVFEWSSEDNGISTFFYNDGGVYLTTLRVTDNEGNTAVDNRTITVIADITEGQQGRDEGESSLPSVSMITALISIGLIAIYRRK